MKRAIGYCLHEECEDYAKGVFLLNYGTRYFCSRCKQEGQIERETAHFRGDGEGKLFKEVRINYDFDPLVGKYHAVAIVRDDSIWGGSSYIVNSPLIKTEKRALKVAESMLANLQRVSAITQGEIIRTTESIICFDNNIEKVREDLRDLEKEWSRS